MSWHVIGEHYHVSQGAFLLSAWVLSLVLQQQVLQWEQADPPWEIPNYVGDLVQALQDTQAWIVTSGAVVMTDMEPTRTMPLTTINPLVLSDSKSEVDMSDEELPTP